MAHDQNGGKERRARDPEATRRRILAAAEAEFARKGYDGSRLRDVAERASVHHALLHHYFGDKEGLFRAVVERAFGRASSRARTILASKDDMEKLFERYIETLVDFHADNPGLVRLLHFASLDEGSPAYAACAELTATFVTPLLELLGDTIAQAQARGRIRSDIDARRLIALCLGAASYLFHEDRYFTRYLGVETRSDESIALHKRTVLRFLRSAVLTD